MWPFHVSVPGFGFEVIKIVLPNEAHALNIKLLIQQIIEFMLDHLQTIPFLQTRPGVVRLVWKRSFSPISRQVFNAQFAEMKLQEPSNSMQLA